MEKDIELDLGYLAWDVRVTLEECEQDGIPCQYIGIGRVDADNAKSNYYAMYEVDKDGFIIKDMTSVFKKFQSIFDRLKLSISKARTHLNYFSEKKYFIHICKNSIHAFM